MAYTKTEWKDLPNTTTPITASNLNNIEDELETLDAELETANDNIDSLDTRLTTAEGDIDNLETRVSNNESNITTLMGSRLIRSNCSYTSSTKQIILKFSVPLDSGLLVLSWHMDVAGGIGGSVIIIIGYYGTIISHAEHNTSTFSISLSGNISSGFSLTIKDDSITSSSTFTAKYTRTKSYAES